MSDYSIYPKAIDGYAQIPLAVDKRSPINAESVNRLRSGIINIEKAIGVAPEFSDEFGSFPDLASRLRSLEGQFVEETSLTALYERDNVLRLDEESLILSAPDGSYLEFYNFDEKFIIGSSTSIELETRGTLPAESTFGLDIPFAWPRTVSLLKSETVPFPFFEHEEGELPEVGAYLALGGDIERSDLAVLKFEDAGWNGGGLIAIVSGINAASDISLDPVSVAIECLGSLKSGVDGAGVEINAGSVNHKFDSAGSVRLRSGFHPDIDGSRIEARGPEWHEGVLRSGSVILSAGGFSDGDGGGEASINCEGAEALSGGDIGIKAGNSVTGGNVTISAGEPNGAVNLIGKNINVNGRLNVDAGFAPAIRKHTASMHGFSCIITYSDYTVLIDSDSGLPTKVSLPHPGGHSQIYNIKRVGDASSTLIICPGGSQDIDGAAGTIGIELTNPWDGVTLQSDGNNWFILSRTG